MELTRVALVGVLLQRVAALGELERVGRHNLVESEGTAGEDLAGVAVAEDGVGLVLLERDFPGCLATDTLAIVRRHVCGCALKVSFVVEALKVLKD
jgi:hypothetical protein